MVFVARPQDLIEDYSGRPSAKRGSVIHNFVFGLIQIADHEMPSFTRYSAPGMWFLASLLA
jgi:hypothetical protein